MTQFPDAQVVLVRTLYPSNIGAVARSMANMGTKRLILIDSQCQVNLRARQAASKAQVELRTRTDYQNWDEYLNKEPQAIQIAFTARPGKHRQVEHFSTALEQIFTEKRYLMDGNIAPISLIFGPEDSGLTNEDIDNTHYSCLLPTFGENVSLNLSQAALVAQLIYRQECLKYFGSALPMPETEPVEREAAPFPESALREWLELLGFDLSQPKTNALVILKRLILTTTPTAKELKVLSAVIQQTIRKLNNKRP